MTVKNHPVSVSDRLRRAEPAPVEGFLDGGYRLLHAQASPTWLPIDVLYALEALGHRATKHTFPAQNATFCCSFWKPGWGLHSSLSVVELRLKPLSPTMTFSHDAWSTRRGTYSTEELKNYSLVIFEDRYIATTSVHNINPHTTCVKNAAELSRFKNHLSKRLMSGGCADPVNETWIRHQDILEVRAIQLHGPSRSNLAIKAKGAMVHSHKVNQLSIKVVTDWHKIPSCEEYFGTARGKSP